MSFIIAGRYLEVDLTHGSWTTVPITDDQVREWLLGSGLAARLFHDRLDRSCHPFDPASPLLVFNGLLSGTFAPTGCRSSWCGRSPLTGIWNEANMGGHWGAGLRAAGYDGLVITGQAPQPVYLWLDGTTGIVELRPAGHLWGLDHYATVSRLEEELGPGVKVACIGQAGENRARMAGVMQGGQAHARTAGRGGMGAVMGSKNLKAIAVRGADKPNYPNLQAFRAHVREANGYIKDNSLGMTMFGTAGGVVATEQNGDFPLKNWTLGNWAAAEKISGQRIRETIWVRNTFCHACPIGCGKEVAVERDDRRVRGHGPEYETLAGFGGMCQVDDLEALTYVNDLCNRYGLDTISASSVIAFAMEAFEAGLLTEEDTAGLPLRWGDPEAVIELIHRIARRQDVGDLLADGVRAAAAQLGGDSEDFAIHVKGMEVPYHDPRAFVSMAANYATSNRGACHLESLSYWNGVGIPFPDLGYPEPLPPHDATYGAGLTFTFQNYLAVYNPLGLCKFIAKGQVGPAMVAELVNQAMGWDWTAGDVLRMGEKLFNLKRLINLRLGVTRTDDTLPKRFLTQPRPTGGAAGVLPDLDRMLRELYQLRGWDEEGRPTTERLEQLGLGELAGTLTWLA